MKIEMIFAFLGGLGLFLYGMNVMAEGLQKVADTKMKSLLEALTKNKFTGVIVGALVTAIIQSSSATTVMVVGFVNAGLMNLSQTVGIIMGANIGTTITSWIVSMGEWSKFLKPEFLSPIAIGIGSFMILFSKRESNRHKGEIIIGFGLLFLGIKEMSSSMSILRESESFRKLLITFGNNPILGILSGALVTAVIQSSSASVTILQTVSKQGLVPFEAAVYIIMGQNIGTCVTAIISSVGASKNAKAAAYIHLLFNVIGSVLLSIVAVIYFKWFNRTLATSFINQTEISIVHTSFNILNTAMLYNFSDYLIKIAEKLTAHIKSDEDKGIVVAHLDDRILETPSFAIQNTIKELARYGDYTLESLAFAREAIIEGDKKYLTNEIFNREKNIDNHEQLIIKYLIKISRTNTTKVEKKLIAQLFKTANDIERVGDHCENLAELISDMIDRQIEFSNKAKDELQSILNLTYDCFKTSITALETNDKDLAMLVVKYEEEIDKLEKELRQSHIDRLMDNECTPNSGILFLDTISNLERIGDHSLNIAQVVLK